MKRILIANIFGIGDVLFTTPLIANLKKEIGDVSVDFLCNARTEGVVECIPGVDDIYVYEKDELVELWNVSKKDLFARIWSLFTSIRKKRYDAVFDLTMSRKFGAFFMLAGIPRRVGLDYRNRGIFLNFKIPFKGFTGRHVVEHYLDLLTITGVAHTIKDMDLEPDTGSKEWAASYLKEKGPEKGPLVAVIPGGGASWGDMASCKRWVAKGFSRTADILASGSTSVAILGDPSERKLCWEVAGMMAAEPVFIENDLSIKEYIALLSKCDLVLCNDGGPLHIAVALGVKTVSIFGPVDEKIYGPYPANETHRVITEYETPCRPCYDKFKMPECKMDYHCLSEISPLVVADTCFDLLKEKLPSHFPDGIEDAEEDK